MVRQAHHERLKLMALKGRLPTLRLTATEPTQTENLRSAMTGALLQQAATGQQAAVRDALPALEPEPQATTSRCCWPCKAALGGIFNAHLKDIMRRETDLALILDSVILRPFS